VESVQRPLVDLVGRLHLLVLKTDGAQTLEEGIGDGKPVIILVTPAEEPLLPLLVVFGAGLLEGTEAHEDLGDELAIGIGGLPRPQDRRLVPGFLAVHAIEEVIHPEAVPPLKVISEGAQGSDSGVADVEALDSGVEVLLELDVDLHGLEAGPHALVPQPWIRSLVVCRDSLEDHGASAPGPNDLVSVGADDRCLEDVNAVAYPELFHSPLHL